MRPRFCLLIPAALGAGCAPTINSLVVEPGASPHQVRVVTRITPGVGSSNSAPQLRVASLANDPPQFVDVQPDFDAGTGTGNVHIRSNLAFRQGSYRVEVRQPYQVIFSTTSQVKTATRDFNIELPAGCFDFDASVQGWTASPNFFDVQANGLQALCSGQQPVAALDESRNLPTLPISPLPGAFRSLVMQTNPLINACFANPSPVPSSGFVAVDLLSPDLTSTPGWATARGYEVHLRGGRQSGNPTAVPLQVQTLLETADGRTFRPQNAGGQPTFVTPGPAAFSVASFAPTVTPASALRRIRLRVFVPSLAGEPPEVRMNVDRVCPVN